MPNDAALLRCHTALELSHVGNYKRSLETMRPSMDQHQRPSKNQFPPPIRRCRTLSFCRHTDSPIKKKDQDQQLRDIEARTAQWLRKFIYQQNPPYTLH